jgi:hypothetical protein
LVTSLSLARRCATRVGRRAGARDEETGARAEPEARRRRIEGAVVALGSASLARPHELHDVVEKLPE